MKEDTWVLTRVSALPKGKTPHDVLPFSAFLPRAASSSWSWRWGMLSWKPSGVQAGRGDLGVGQAPGLFYTEIYTVLTDFLYLFSPPGICISKTWRCTEFKCLSLDSFQKQAAFYLDLYNLVLGGPPFQNPCAGNQICHFHTYLQELIVSKLLHVHSLWKYCVRWGTVLVQMSRGTWILQHCPTFFF